MHDQYHEPFSELTPEVRTLARIFASLKEEAEAINWYTQRISVEADSEAKQIMAYARDEEFRHFGIDLEFLLRRLPQWRNILQSILFSNDDITEKADIVPASLIQEDDKATGESDPEQLLKEFLQD